MRFNRRRVMPNLVAVAAVVLALVRLVWPSTTVDNTSIALLVVALVAYYFDSISRLKLPGGAELERQIDAAADVVAKGSEELEDKIEAVAKSAPTSPPTKESEAVQNRAETGNPWGRNRS
jgi:hypothetical protein